MKNSIYLFALVLTFVSCSSSSDSIEKPPTDTEGVLVQKTIYTDTDDLEQFTLNFNYQGNQLMSVTEGDGNGFMTFTYENELIVKVNYLYSDDPYTELKYDDNNNLIEIIEYYDSNLEPQNYKLTYNNDDTVTLKYYYKNVLSHVDEIIFDGNGNIVEITSDDDDFESSFSYDTKNNAYKNISQIEVLNLLWVITEYGSFSYGSYNNLIKWGEINQGVNDIDIYEYTYNENDYPITLKHFYEGEEDWMEEYFYE